MKNKVFFIVLGVAFIGLMFSAFRVMKTVVTPKVKVADKRKVFKPAPDFTLLSIYGEEVSLSDYKGKVVILDFWTTWCPPCKAELPHFIELYDEYKDKGLEVIGVSLDWNADRVVLPFAESNGINYTLLIGNEEMTDTYGGIMSIPTTFIIDRNGGIRKKYIGYQAKEIFESDIKEIL